VNPFGEDDAETTNMSESANSAEILGSGEAKAKQRCFEVDPSSPLFYIRYRLVSSGEEITGLKRRAGAHLIPSNLGPPGGAQVGQGGAQVGPRPLQDQRDTPCTFYTRQFARFANI